MVEDPDRVLGAVMESGLPLNDTGMARGSFETPNLRLMSKPIAVSARRVRPCWPQLTASCRLSLSHHVRLVAGSLGHITVTRTAKASAGLAGRDVPQR